MTKIEAIKKVIDENGGIASLKHIYENIESYYPGAKNSSEWEAGIRGVIYRAMKDDQSIKKVGIGVFALQSFNEEKDRKEILKDEIKMHSFAQGMLIEIGNLEGYLTFCPDPAKYFRTNVKLGDLTTISTVPQFTYEKIIESAKWIDCLWFNKKGYQFPKNAIEVVDSISTLEKALNRMYQLKDFQTKFNIIVKTSDKEKAKKALTKEPYNREFERYSIKTFEEIITMYSSRIQYEAVKF